MASRDPILPDDPRYYALRVLRSEQVSPSYHRVTATGEDLASFDYRGGDHWFRLFTPPPGADRAAEFRMPTSTGRGWYQELLAIPTEHRPHLANYTIRDFRADARELDIDFVLHTDGRGEPAGRAALWAMSARPGDRLAILDQGLLFNPPADTTEVWLVADETGLPATESILRSLDPNTAGCAVIEVPTGADVRELVKPARVDIHWVPRSTSVASAGAKHAPEPAALATLSALTHRRSPDRGSYAFAVGESRLATGARRELAGRGLSKSRITFCGFYKH